MAKTRLRIDRSIQLSTGVSLGAVLLTACLLHAVEHWGQAPLAEERRAMRAATLVASQAGPLLKRRIDDPLQAWARVLKTQPSVCLVAVHDKTGGIRAIETDTPLLAKRAAWSKNVMAGLYEPAAWHLTEDDGREVCGVMVPIFVAPDEPPVGQLTMGFVAAETTTTPAATSSAWLRFYIPLMTVALMAWWLANQSMARRVIDPFSRLCRTARRRNDVLPVDRKDQLGDLARAFKQMHEQIAHWRAEAKGLEIKLERKLANQSRNYIQQLKKVSRQAEVDPLTGLSNRRVLDAHLDQIIQEHNEQGLDLTVVMIDVDNFKMFNDTHGHPTGDELLSLVGQLLGKSIREEDLAVRLGGDEFALILPGTDEYQAGKLAERLIALFGQIAKTLPPVSRPPSLSAGVADLRGLGATSGEALLRAADEALYRAKLSGKRQVVTAT